jgi:hypothetical protein
MFMKSTVLWLFFAVAACLLLSGVPPAVAQTKPLAAAEVSRILADRTFLLVYVNEKRESNHIYFAGDGKYTMLFPGGKVRSSDTWKVEGDNFCLRRALRSGGDTRYISKCGPVTLAGPNALNLHDEEGKHIYTLQFLGNGNLLDRFAR